MATPLSSTAPSFSDWVQFGSVIVFYLILGLLIVTSFLSGLIRRRKAHFVQLHSLLLLGCSCRIVWAILCLVPATSAYFRGFTAKNVPAQLVPELTSLCFYFSFLSLITHWAYVYYRAKMLMRLHGKNGPSTQSDDDDDRGGGQSPGESDAGPGIGNEPINHVLHLKLKLQFAFWTLVLCSIVYVLSFAGIAIFFQQPILYTIPVVILFFPLLATITSVGFVIFGFQLFARLRLASEPLGRFDNLNRRISTQLKKIGGIALFGSFSYLLRAFVVVILNVLAISFPEFDQCCLDTWITILFYVALEWWPTLLVVILFSIFVSSPAKRPPSQRQSTYSETGPLITLH